mgnify:CR=1 FL=1
MNIHIETGVAPDAGIIEFLEGKLMAHNREKIPGYAYENAILTVRDEADGDPAAGLHGQIGGGWFYVASLWVRKGCRGQGIGKGLLTCAEELARKKNCTGAYLYTYSFQNPGFYERLGYEIFGTLPHFCGDGAKYYMKKMLIKEE